MKLRVAAMMLAIALAAAPASARAEPTTGGYVLGGIGANWLDDADRVGGGVASFDRGWTGVAGLGYGFGNGVRLQGELGYADQPSAAGGLNAVSLMGDALFDVPVDGALTPYIGVGAGVIRLRADNLVTPGFSAVIDDTDVVPAFQGTVGLAYDVADRLKLDLGYRYLYAPDARLRDGSGGGIDGSYRDQSVLLGLRYQLNGR